MRVKGTTSELAKKQRKSSQQQQNATNSHSNNRKSSVNSDNDDDDGVNNGGGNNINGKACIHLSKAINNLSQLRKTIKQQPIGECTSCNELKRVNNTEPTTTTTTNQTDSSHQPSIWMCLSCGHQGCDRSSEAQHALKHYQTPRSTIHCICLNLDSWSFWCYECDEEICVNGKKVEEVISFIKKAAQQQQQPQHLQVNQNNDRSSSIERFEIVRYLNVNQAQQQQQTKKQQQQGNNATVQSSSAHQKVAGLHNLGNTCFFNAVLQNLAQTPGLDSLLQDNTSNGNKQEMLQLYNDNESDASELSDNEEQDTNNNNKKRHKQTNSNNKSEQLVISINEAGSMTNSFYYLLKEMNSSRSNVSPGGLFGLVCKKVPSFKGYQQQDSHELLRHLLDAIKAEEIKRRQTGILSALSVNTKCVDDSTKLKIKNFGRLINYTFIDSLFGGHLLSTIVCEQCKTCSQNIEPFLDLSLSIIDDKTVHNILINPNKIAKSNDNVSLYIDDPRDNPAYVSKNQLKKQKKQSKKVGKTKTKQQLSTTSTTVGATNNQSDDEQDEIDDENTNNTVNEQTDDNVSNEQQQQTTKSSDECSLNTIEKSLNDCVDNAIPNSLKLEAMQSLSRRTPTLLSSDEQSENANPCSLQSCLLKFTSPELLTGNNKFGCETCTRNYYRKLPSSNASKDNNNSQKTIYTQALKQYLICELPAVLTIHLKRFQQHGFRLEKVNKFVNFPIELDMSPYTSKLCTNINSSQRILYSLFGVVEHSGRLNGGHYTAYVKVKHQKQQQQNIEKFLVKKKLQTLHANILKQQQLNGGSNPSISTSTEDATCAAIVEANNELNATSSSSQQQQQPSSSSSTSLLSNNPTSSSTWYYISDSHVSEVPESKILKLQAYILFYERIA